MRAKEASHCEFWYPIFESFFLVDQNKSNKVTLSNIIQKLENTKKYDFLFG